MTGRRVSYCLCCHRIISPVRLLCYDCTAPLNREPKTEWGRQRKRDREALASVQEPDDGEE